MNSNRPFVARRSGEQQGITLLALQGLLQAVTNYPSWCVLVPAMMKQDRDRQVVMGDVVIQRCQCGFNPPLK